MDIPIDPALTSNGEGPIDPQTVAFLQALVAAAGHTKPQLISTSSSNDPWFLLPHAAWLCRSRVPEW